MWVVDLRSPNERAAEESTSGGAVTPSSNSALRVKCCSPSAVRCRAGGVERPEHSNGGEWRYFYYGGHSGSAANTRPDTVARISKFTKDGKFIKSSANLDRDQLTCTPHDRDGHAGTALSPTAAICVQILDQEGIHRRMEAVRPPGAVSRCDAYSMSPTLNQRRCAHPGWSVASIGSIKDGKVIYRIPDPLELKGTSAAEGVAVDANGNVYGGEE